MNFKECTGASQAWCLESGTSFKVDFIDEEERKIHFKWQGEDEEESSDIKFSITVPIKDDSSSKWMFWSENEDVLNTIMEMHDYTDACKEKSFLQILSKVDSLLKPLTDPDNESEADEIEDDYYADDDIDASMPEADQDMARGAEGIDSGEEDEVGANFFGDVGSKAAVARLMSDLKTMKKESNKFGLDGTPRGDNLFIWDIKLKDFPVESKLGKNLKEYSEKFKREPVIQLEMQFPHDYPMTPPFVRVVRPRFKFLTGHITIGGSICMEMLTKSGWRPINDIEMILVQIRSEIMSDSQASLDMNDADRPYGEQEARDAFNRMVKRYGWNS
ncbi:ubiquitin-conjugating enzyme E2 Q2-like [Mytilus californianus]|uniref:ubiquitin-conjugating enzyme E2 Q2-like n=1 Tax=Mytilus californianus TaxID=6549 RepID=UPI002247B1EB|nr:ubiquitin-conjugating enzyme E2 Q2-like [Mytilus californianus]